jgi:hypothetical protein
MELLPTSHFARSDFIADEFSTGFKKAIDARSHWLSVARLCWM